MNYVLVFLTIAFEEFALFWDQKRSDNQLLRPQLRLSPFFNLFNSDGPSQDLP
jgi:hypothetical protein